MVPFLEESDQLVALLSHLFVGEEQKFGLSVDLDKQVLSLLDERIAIDAVDELSQTFRVEFTNRRNLSADVEHKLLLGGVLNLSLQIALLVHGGQVSIVNNEEVPLGLTGPSNFARLGSSSQVGIQEVGRMLLEANVLIDAGVVGENQGAEGELEIFAGAAVVLNKFMEIAENNSHFSLFLMPSGDVLRNFSLFGLVLLVESSVGRMNILAFCRLLVLDLDGMSNIFKLDPGLTSMMEKLGSQSFDLFDVASIHKSSSKGPADLRGSASKEERNSRQSIGENVPSFLVAEYYWDEDTIQDVLGFNILDQNGLTGLGESSVGCEYDILFQEGHERMQKLSEHKLVHVFVELVGEEFVQSEAGGRLLSVHPGTRLFSFVAKRSSDFGSHPLQSVIVLDHKAIESPDSVYGLHRLSSFWKTSRNALSVLNYNRIVFRNYLLFLRFFLFLIFFVFFVLLLFFKLVLTI